MEFSQIQRGSGTEKQGMDMIVTAAKKWYRGVVSPFELIKDNFGGLVGFTVFFRLFTFFVLFPLLTWSQRLWLIGGGTNVIAWYNIGSFIKNPVSWVVLIFMAALLVAGTMYEQFALYDALHASRFGIKRSVRQIISAGFDMSSPRQFTSAEKHCPFMDAKSTHATAPPPSFSRPFGTSTTRRFPSILALRAIFQSSEVPTISPSAAVTVTGNISLRPSEARATTTDGT